MVGFAIAELRRIQSVQPSLSFASTAVAVPEGTTVLTVGERDWRLNGQVVEESDRLFRLSGAAARATAIMVEYPAQLPARELDDALETLSRAGFTQVGMRVLVDDDATTTGITVK